MKFKVDQELCIGCGACEGVCPEVFEMRDDDIAYVIIDTVPAELEESAIEAEESCPVEAISHE